MTLTTIQGVKTWVGNEKQRLEGRMLEANQTPQELSSLQGSLMTIRKLQEALR